MELYIHDSFNTCIQILIGAEHFMDLNLIIGLAIIVLAYGFTFYLIVYSRRSIEKIDKKNLNNVKEILRELHHGR